MIAFIDCYIDTPVFNCVNQFVEQTNIPSTYHVPSKFGTDSLNAIKDPKCFVVLGSAAHVTENPVWQSELLNFIIPKLESGVPVLGICYGHQLLAQHYGCRVDYINFAKENFKELRAVQLNKAIGNLIPQTLHMAYAHSQVVKEISNQIEAIGHSNFSEFEIIKHKTLPFLGTQAHPEASRAYLKNELMVGEHLNKVINDGQSFISEFYYSC